MGAKVKFSVREIDRGFDKLKQDLKRARDDGAYVKAGVIGTGASEQHGEVSNAALAAIHEFGAPDAGIPERSFIRSTFDANKTEYIGLLRKGVSAVYRGKASIEHVLKLVGLRMENDIRKRVRTGAGIPPPLKQATIDRKGSSRPLVDTGQLIASVSSAVVLKGGGK